MAVSQRVHTARSMPRREKSGPVFCVGWKAFVHWPAPAAAAVGQVPLVDLDGRHLSNDLLDGQQVEIVAWQPRSRESALYKIRRVADGREGWIGGQHLRRDAVAPAAEEPPSP